MFFKRLVFICTYTIIKNIINKGLQLKICYYYILFIYQVYRFS